MNSSSAKVTAPPANSPTAQRPAWQRFTLQVGLAGVLFVALNSLFPSFYVPTASMEPAIPTGGGRIATASFWEPGRGDVAVFDRPQAWREGPTPLVKRVAAVPGDHVQALGDGTILVNGDVVQHGAAASPLADVEFEVPEGHVWMLGDNQDHSADSRYEFGHNRGLVPMSDVRSRALFVFWPLDRVGVL